MRMRRTFGLLIATLALSSICLPAAASIPVAQIGSQEHKIYKDDMGKAGPAGKQETIELDEGADA